MIGRVGDDGFGTAVLRRLRAEAVHVRFMTTDPAAPTGILARERRALGPSEVTYHRAASAGSRLDHGDVEAAAELIGAARWLHVTGITPALSSTARAAVLRAVEIARAASATISLDLNLRRKLWSDAEAAPVLRDLAARVDVVLGTLDEVAVLTGSAGAARDLARSVFDLGPAVLVLKLGPEGAIAFERDGTEVRRPGQLIPAVVDPVGAGDLFAAGFIAARLDGDGLERALDIANACGAAAVAALGDVTGAPTPAEVERLLAPPGDDTRR
jgi:2-dehydro-3-deoxygluconokinase